MSTTDADPDMLDHRVYLHGVSWEDYERLLRMRGDRAVPRITYLEGVVELMSPSEQHEWIGAAIGRLLVAWSDHQGVDLNALKSWTLKQRLQEVGLEPDECYRLGSRRKPRPDLAIEVIWTSGGIDKLEIYRGLRVPEVWFWKASKLRIYVLRKDRYQLVKTSRLFPSLDLDELLSFVERPSQFHAAREYRALLRSRSPEA